MSKSYSISTTDKTAFDRLIDVLADLGGFTVRVVEIKDPPAASKPLPQRSADPPTGIAGAQHRDETKAGQP